MPLQEVVLISALGGAAAGGAIVGLVVWVLIIRLTLGVVRDVSAMRDSVLEMCQAENVALRTRIRELERQKGDDWSPGPTFRQAGEGKKGDV